MEERLFITDIEFIVVLVGLCVIVCLAFNTKKGRDWKLAIKPGRDWLCLDKSTSVLVKGIACIFILLSHYSARILGGGLPKGVTYYVTIYAANIALILFMFLSGYGLSIKRDDENLLYQWMKRIKKVYLPLVFVCTICTIIKISSGLSGGGILLLSALGFTDEWYVICIIYFYTLFYLAVYISNCLKINDSIILSIFMLVYYAVAYRFYGFEEGHFFRFPCAFMLGHLVAKGGTNNKKLAWSLGVIFVATILPHGLHYAKCYLLAFLLLISFGMIQKLAQVNVCSWLYKLGVISFFFYLVHERLGFPLMSRIGIYSCLLWIVLTIILACFLQWIYNKMLRLVQ